MTSPGADSNLCYYSPVTQNANAIDRPLSRKGA
jgi:hypothetical protein